MSAALRLPVAAGGVEDVTAAVHLPVDGADLGLAALLTPGAGGDLDGAPLTGLAEALASLGVTVVRANLPHHESGRRAPRADRSVAPLGRMLEGARQQVAPDAAWLAGGKSYGGRVATIAAAEGAIDVVGLVLHGYPLHPPGKPEQLRVDHWPQIRVRTLFLQGERDAFGGPDELTPHLTKLPRRAAVVAVVGGDHSLDVAGVHAPDGVKRPAAEVIARLDAPIAAWLRDITDELAGQG